MPTVRLPAPFVSYACQRSLVCCQHPLRAPCDTEEETRVAIKLASTEAGRAYLPILRAGFEEMRETRVFKHSDDRCVHLVTRDPLRPEIEHGCSLHVHAGFDALPNACKNYPRWITKLPPAEPAELEAVFLMACPTAAALLVQNPGPFQFVEVPLAGWRYPPVRATTEDDLAAVRDLRRDWWRLLAEGRDDPRRLAALLAALYRDPMHPPAAVYPDGTLPDELLQGVASLDAGFVLDAIQLLPGRGTTYATLQLELWGDLTCPLEARTLLDALDIAPGILTAFLDHHIPFAAVHDTRPVRSWLRSAVRRTLAVARMADTLLARVPYGIDVLFGDLLSAGMHLDAMDTSGAAEP